MPAAATRQNPTQTTPITDLSPVQAQVVAALAQGLTVTAAAQDAGIHRATIYEWFKTVPGFKKAVDESREDFKETLRDDLKTLSAKALSALHEILDNPKAPAGARVRAALAVLQRPQFPDRGWNLPAPAASPKEQAILEQLALVEADYKHMRMTEALDKQASVGPRAALIPRGSPCPCGSGEKYKRCCGKHAPPVLAA